MGKEQKKKLLVLGIGNVLMGDEGVGVHCVQKLDMKQIPKNVEVVDGGTGGFHMLNYLSDYETIIMIDATMDKKEAGTITLLEPHFASDFPRSLSSHDIGLRDLLESASLLADLPKIYLFTVTVADLQTMHMELSPTVETSIPILHQKIITLLKQLEG